MKSSDELNIATLTLKTKNKKYESSFLISESTHESISEAMKILIKEVFGTDTEVFIK